MFFSTWTLFGPGNFGWTWISNLVTLVANCQLLNELNSNSRQVRLLSKHLINANTFCYVSSATNVCDLSLDSHIVGLQSIFLRTWT